MFRVSRLEPSNRPGVLRKQLSWSYWPGSWEQHISAKKVQQTRKRDDQQHFRLIRGKTL